MLDQSFPGGGRPMREPAAYRCDIWHLGFTRWPASLQILTGMSAWVLRVATVFAVVVCGGVVGGARASASGLDTTGALVIGALPRTYQVHIPPGVDRPRGLVINLHGAGQTAGEQAALTNYNAVADQHGFAVVYPDGIDLSWADGRGASTPDRQGVDDVGFLVALADRLTAEYNIEPGHVFATGMSAGAFMAGRLACQRADVVSAIAPVAGSLGAGYPCNPSEPVSVLATNGVADPVVPYAGGTMVGRGGASDIVAPAALAGRWRELDGCPAAPVEDSPSAGVRRSTAAGCAGGTEVVFVSVDGGGHEWFGGTSQASGQFFADQLR
jgi:polyhydroxybutyrate depolymerase